MAWLAFSLVLGSLSALTTSAQESRATLTGTVSDSQGAAVAGASVVAKHTATNVESKATTNDSGLYVLPFLPTGRYTVTVSLTGFKTAVKNDVDLNISERRQLDFRLEIGEVTESVTVSASTELLNTANAVRFTTIDAQKVADLPLLGKNPYTLAYHALGVSHINPQGSVTDRPYDNGGMDAITINGGRAFTNEYLLDGAPNTNTERSRPNSLSFVPPPEATEEISVMSNNYDAQYGRTGGGVISATLKSGTNRLHATAYEYFRNEVLNANTFQANLTGKPRDPFRWNQPGVTASGPVYIPRLYNGRNRSFFLFSWEGIYQNIPPTNPLETVPTLLERSGDFSDLRTRDGRPSIIYDPTTTVCNAGSCTRTAFQNNKIPQDRLDPVALKILDYISKPNRAPDDLTGVNNYDPPTGRVTRERYNAFAVKWDQIITPAEKLSATYIRNKRWQTGPDYGWPAPVMGPNNFMRKNLGAGLQLTSTLSPSFVLTTRFGATQHTFQNFMYGGGFDPTTLGFPASQVAQAQGLFFPRINFAPATGNYTSFGQTGNNADVSTNWYLTASAVKVLSKHSVKFGGEYRVLFDNLPNYSFANFSFTKQWTQSDPNNASATAGNAFASFLLGYATNSGNDRSYSPFNATPAWGSHYYGLYIQDDWRVRHNLTINIGGRWDYDSPYTERYNRLDAGFDLTSSNPIEAQAKANYAGNPIPQLSPDQFRVRGGLLFTSPQNRLPYDRDLNNFQPRVGVAYQFMPKTVFRAGYGLSYIPTFVFNNTTAVIGTQGFSVDTPFIISTDANRTPVGHLYNPFPGGMLRPTGSSLGLATLLGQPITYVYPYRTTPYMHQFSAGFQRELPWDILVDISYVRSQTRQLGTSKNINALSAARLALGTATLDTKVTNPMAEMLPGSSFNDTTIPLRQLLRPYPEFDNVFRNEFNNGRSWYNALQLQAQKRLSHGFDMLVNYTWSETMEAAGYLNAQASDDQLERVRTAEDLPHRLSILGRYELPFFRHSRGFRKAIFSGWQVDAIAILQSGRQLNGVDLIPTGVSPILSGPKTPNGYYFNACTLNTSGQRQNCASPDQPVAWIQRPSDTLRVTSTRWSQLREQRPPLLDSSIFKTFYPKEGFQVQFRAEMFNTFNTPWFGLADTSLTSTRFGLLGNAQVNDQRNIQLALKLSF